MRNARAFLAGVLFCLIASASANDHPNLSAEAVRQQQKDIRAAVEAGRGTFKDLPTAKRNELIGRQDRVSKLLEGIQRTTDLGELQQIDLFNELEAIQAIVNAAEDERMICRRERPTGTNRPQTVCKTVAQRRADREAIERDTGRRSNACSDSMVSAGMCN